MKTKLITFTVENLEASMHFYIDILGFNIAREMKLDRLSLVFLSNESDVSLELICKHDGEYLKSTSDNMSVGIEFQNVPDIVDKLRANDYSVHGPISPAPNTTFYMVKDPDGFNIQLL